MVDRCKRLKDADRAETLFYLLEQDLLVQAGEWDTMKAEKEPFTKKENKVQSKRFAWYAKKVRELGNSYAVELMGDVNE